MENPDTKIGDLTYAKMKEIILLNINRTYSIPYPKPVNSIEN